MKQNYSAPVIQSRSTRGPLPGRGIPGQGQTEEKKRIDYSHLDIIAEAERIIGSSLKRHTRTSGKYTCQCPFPECSSKHDAFLVFDRPELEEGQVHFWCNRCNRRGSLVDLLKELKGYTFKEACADLRIDTRTWRAIGSDQDTSSARSAEIGEKKRRQTEQRYKAEQEEIATIGAWYNRARAWLAAGCVTMKDGRQIALDQAAAYLAERGFTLDQAAALGLAYIPTARELPEIASDPAIANWRGRVIFPLTFKSGATGYAGRSLFLWRPGMTAEEHKKRLEVKQIARYYKTRQAAYYGYDLACKAATLVIVEGEFDAASVRLALADTDIAVCAMGKNFQARLVPLNVLHVILALDCDQAGQEAIERQIDELEARGVTVGIAIPGAGKDWNECHQLAGLDVIREAMLIAGPDDFDMPAAPAPLPDLPVSAAAPKLPEAEMINATGFELFSYRVSQVAAVFGGATVRDLPPGFTLADRVKEIQAELPEAEDKSAVYWKGLHQRLARQGYYDQIARDNIALAARVATYRERWL